MVPIDAGPNTQRTAGAEGYRTIIVILLQAVCLACWDSVVAIAADSKIA